MVLLNLMTRVTRVHVSKPEHVQEKSYKSPMKPKDAMALLHSMDREVLDSPVVTREVIGDRPNTYTFTKALAENILETEGKNLPLAIIRPSIVAASWKEPAPGKLYQ